VREADVIDEELGDPEVQDLHQTARRVVADEDVIRLDVTVDDAAQVSRLEAGADLHRDREDRIAGHRPP
jgi:hypothetical protein